MWFEGGRPEGEWFIDPTVHVFVPRDAFPKQCATCFARGVTDKMGMHVQPGQPFLVRTAANWNGPFVVDRVAHGPLSQGLVVLVGSGLQLTHDDLVAKNPVAAAPNHHRIWVTQQGAPVFYEEMTMHHLQNIEKKLHGRGAAMHQNVAMAQAYAGVIGEMERRVDLKEGVTIQELPSGVLVPLLPKGKTLPIDMRRESWAGGAHIEHRGTEFGVIGGRPAAAFCARCPDRLNPDPLAHAVPGQLFEDPEGQLVQVISIPANYDHEHPVMMRGAGKHKDAFRFRSGSLHHRFAPYDALRRGPDPRAGFRLRPWEDFSDASLNQLAENPMKFDASPAFARLMARAHAEVWRRQKQQEEHVGR